MTNLSEWDAPVPDAAPSTQPVPEVDLGDYPPADGPEGDDTTPKAHPDQMSAWDIPIVPPPGEPYSE